MSKWETWYDNLPEHTKEYLKKQPIWYDRDLVITGLMGTLFGFFVGVIVGFEWAWRPVVDAVRPFIR